MDIVKFISSLSVVATSPLALVGYVILISAWGLRTWLFYTPQRQARQILQIYSNDVERLSALKSLVGNEPPPGLRKDEMIEWVNLRIREKTRVILLIAYIATLLTIVLIIGMALFNVPSKQDSPPVLIEERVIRHTEEDSVKE